MIDEVCPVGAFQSLVNFHPNIVISGEFGFRSLITWLYCRLSRAQQIIWSEETPHHAKNTSIFQRQIRRFLAKRSKGFLAWGKQAELYLHSLNIVASKITYCAQSVDNDFWSTLNISDKLQIRDKYNILGKVVLYVGSLIQRKGIEWLIKGWASLPEQIRSHNTLLIVGGGEQESTLKQLVNLTSAQNVIFTGAIPRRNLRQYYAIADVFVFPSLLDVWGLVVNEAMAAGIPVLCSRFAGCADELIIEGVTGNTIDPREINEFASFLAHWLLEGPKPPVEHIQRHISQWSFQDSEKSILLAIEKALGYPAVL
ncbi:MAG: glycosyltransferase family 4 protein [Chloroflexi bacterium]|nr:glycosyltransferase family 4 protein [Chloroflexota bacterium]